MTDELIDICEKLNRHNVVYLIIGGCAVDIYGYNRITLNPKNEESDKLDIDIWFNPTYENYYGNLCSVFEELGLDKRNYMSGTDIKKCFIQLDFDDFNLDCLPILENFPKTFRECYRNRNVKNIDGVELFFISLSDLILTKENTNRPKDIRDIKELKKIKNIQRFEDF